MPYTLHYDLGSIGNAVMQDFSNLIEIWQVALADDDECWDVDFVELLDGGRVQKSC